MNNRKAILVMVLFAWIGVSGVFAFGIGLQFDGDPYGQTAGPAITFKLDSCPVVFAANLDITAKYFSLGLTGDWWLFDKQIDKSLPVKWYFGYGFFAHIGMGDPFAFVAGGRLPVGINAFLAKGFFEPYLQVALSLGVALAPSFHLPEWYIPVSLGARFWFK